MNKLVLIGNGFDLAHGLKTSYSDFIVWYLNKVSKAICSDMFYEDAIIHYTTSYRTDYNEIKSIQDFLDFMELPYIKGKIEFKHAFFSRLIRNLTLRKWVDIEYEYFFSVIDVMNKTGFANKGKEYQDALEVLKKLNLCFDNLKKELLEYLGSLEYKKYNHRIEDRLEDYICKPDEGEHNNKLFLNFNYTSTIKNYWELVKTPQAKVGKQDSIIVNIHGKLGDDENPIIFGYGDEKNPHYPDIENLNENEFLKNIKSFWYSQTGNYQVFSRFIEAEEFKVFILGHSCGISDRILLKSIFEHDNCNSIQIFYHKRADGTNDYFEKTQEISRHFSAENKHKMRNKILPFNESCSLI